MSKLEKDFLFQAANAPIGIELESTDVDKDYARLSQERTKDSAFKGILVRRGPREGTLWLIRKDILAEMLPRPSGPDVSLEDLDIA